MLGRGMPISGHEFHYSRVECGNDAKFAVKLSRGKGIHNQYDGLSEHRAVGAYTHAYFSKDMAASIVKAAKTYRKS